MIGLKSSFCGYRNLCFLVTITGRFRSRRLVVNEIGICSHLRDRILSILCSCSSLGLGFLPGLGLGRGSDETRAPSSET